MKIKNLFRYLFGLLVISGVFLVGCGSNNSVQSISLKGYEQGQIIETCIGEFNFEDYSLDVVYKNNTISNVQLTSSMIKDTDLLKFYQEGEHLITIVYKNAEYQFNIRVLRFQFDETVVLNDLQLTYTGQDIVVEVEGNVPAGTQIIYPQGNVFKNAGTYDMTAVLQCENYISKTLTARITVNKAEYDLTNAKLYSNTVTYNGQKQGISLKGSPFVDEIGNTIYSDVVMPQGVDVTYSIAKIKDEEGYTISAPQEIEGNSATDAGTYRVTAKFKGDAVNYNIINDSVAILVIEKSAISTENIVIEDKQTIYTGAENSIEVVNINEISNKLNSTYYIKKIKDSLGNDVQEQAILGNSCIDAGVYKIEVVFNVIDTYKKNYYPNPSSKTAILTIERASYEQDVEDIYLEEYSYIFEKDNEYTISLDGALPLGVDAQFKIVDKNNTTIQGEHCDVINEVEDEQGNIISTIHKSYKFKVVEAGEYDCIVNFEHSNPNYYPIQPKSNRFFIDSKIKEVEVLNNSEPIQSLIGQFDFKNCYIKTIDLDDVELDIEISQDMVFPGEEDKFNTLGINTIKMIYEGIVFEIQIDVKEFVFDDNVNMNDVVTDYTGDNISTTVNNLPTGASVTYAIMKYADGNGNYVTSEAVQGLNSAREPGKYIVTAVIEHSNYITKTVKANLQINLLEYVPEFNDLTVAYDGNSHSLEVFNIPSDIVVSYYIKKVKNHLNEDVSDSYNVGNSASEIGTYQIEVTFGYPDYYKAINSVTAYLIIN